MRGAVSDGGASDGCTAARTQSLWYWVKRESGRAQARDHLYVKGQPGDLFLSKLAAMVVGAGEQWLTELTTAELFPPAAFARSLVAEVSAAMTGTRGSR